MTPMPLGLFVEKLQPKFGLYEILFAYFVVEAKSKNDILAIYPDLYISW